MSSIKNLDGLFEKQEEKNRVEPGTLYLVATPIGNLMDISARALKVLCGVDFVAAEDTRNTGRLLQYFEIDRPMVSYFEHNRRARGEVIAARLAGGESCALVTDAGMPAISDPGEDLVVLCHERGIPVRCVPGCCAAVTALALSGLPTARFAFEGFLSGNTGVRRRRLESLRREDRTMIFYEAPHKLRTMLDDLHATFGVRRLSLCRELTKLNEETLLFTTESAVAYYRTHEPRGEYVLILEGATDTSDEPQNCPLCALPAEEHVAAYMAADPTLRRNDAIRRAAKDRGLTKSALYQLLLEKDDPGNKSN